MKYFLFICLLFVSPINVNAANNNSLAQNLAVLDDYGTQENDAMIVNRFRYLVNAISASFNEDRQTIAETTFMSKKLLADRGIDESLLNIMEGFNSIFGNKTGGCPR